MSTSPPTSSLGDGSPKANYGGLRDRAVLITGAAGGLGRALARSFAYQGARLALSDVHEESLGELCGSLPATAGIVALPADLSEVSACAHLVADVVAAFGRIDVLVNNAALLSQLPVASITADDFDRVIAINLRAPFFLAQASLVEMRKRRFGRIVNIASMAARTGGASDAFVYAASKAGLVALTKALARTAASDGVLANAILPANIDTSMLQTGFGPEHAGEVVRQIPLGRLAAPEEVAELVLWLASDACSYVTGAGYEIAGGWMM